MTVIVLANLTRTVPDAGNMCLFFLQIFLSQYFLQGYFRKAEVFTDVEYYEHALQTYKVNIDMILALLVGLCGTVDKESLASLSPTVANMLCS